MNKMHIEDFKSRMVGYLDDFVCNWIAKHQENPEIWPLEINSDNSGVWMEHFLYHIENTPHGNNKS